MLAHQLDEVVGRNQHGGCTGLGCESPLRIAAATLSCSSSDEVTATTVVGVLGRDDAPAMEALVAGIAAEFGLESRIRTNVGSFSVRFSRAALSPHLLQH
jgi:hypothetical protein